MEDMDIRAIAQLGCNLLLSRSFVAHQTDDQVIRVFRDLSEEFKLCWIRYRRCRLLGAGRLTPIPLDTPVIT